MKHDKDIFYHNLKQHLYLKSLGTFPNCRPLIIHLLKYKGIIVISLSLFHLYNKTGCTKLGQADYS